LSLRLVLYFMSVDMRAMGERKADARARACTARRRGKSLYSAKLASRSMLSRYTVQLWAQTFRRLARLRLWPPGTSVAAPTASCCSSPTPNCL